MTGDPNLAAALLGPLLRGDPHRPRLTTYVGGFRTELSTASLANWSAKVAGLLVDELGLGPGDGVQVAVGAGWQTAPILLGSWWAGLTVLDVEDGAAVAFVPDGGDSGADDIFVVSGHPLGAPSRSVAPHQRDFTGAVLPQADRFAPRGAAAPIALRAGDGQWSVTELLMAASSVGLEPGSRLASIEPWSMPDGLISGLLATLAVDGSLLWSDATGATLVEQARAERATVTAGFTVPGLPELD
ncbi:TIGR03089 family protein [Nakamurella panacisegetis]|uniref:TIGR03089 family protein n=1 Tax=Nakamurella panacisegetis TaxID=1090615 RepID=A0A1H0PGC5_9ACTN|nr:TIGR03089 family protein [Nakamurella panacisegetis]SDP04101.1 TIGR03089 family protein [Nakamurella panacisegetis]